MTGWLLLLLSLIILAVLFFSPVIIRFSYNGKVYVRLTYAPLSILLYPSFKRHNRQRKQAPGLPSRDRNMPYENLQHLSFEILKHATSIFRCKVVYFETRVGGKTADQTAYLTWTLHQLISTGVSYIQDHYPNCSFRYVNIEPCFTHPCFDVSAAVEVRLLPKDMYRFYQLLKPSKHYLSSSTFHKASHEGR